ncbi:transposable element Tcb1 transposase [Trichonephila clavipes]|nr:transposable element Tcb1 transposase [Trichonephila clavipes]
MRDPASNKTSRRLRSEALSRSKAPLPTSTGRSALWRTAEKISSRVGQNQTFVMRMCDRWMQEDTTDRRGRSHPPQCITSCEDRQIVCMAVMDRSHTSRTVAQHIEFVTHHHVQFLRQSGLSALLGLTLTQNHRRLRHQWCDERRMWAAELNEIVFIDESRICLQHHDGRIRVWRHRGEKMLNSCVLHRHTGSAPGTMVCCGIRYHSRTPLVHIAGTLNRQRYISKVLEPFVLPYLQGFATAIFHRIMRYHMWHALSKGYLSITRLNCFPGRLALQIFTDRKHFVHGCSTMTQIAPPAATPDQLWQRVEATWSAVPQEHIQSLFELMLRRVAVVISNNGGY